MLIMYYATATREAVESAYRPRADFGDDSPDIWHFASLNDRSFHLVSGRPVTVADYNTLKEYLTPQRTDPMGFAREFVEHVSGGIEEILISED